MFFGPDYVSGMTPAVTISVAAGLRALSTVYAAALIVLGSLRWYTAANFLGPGGLFVVTGVLTPKIGSIERASLMVIATFVYAFATLKSGVFGIDIKAYFASIGGPSIMTIVVFAIPSTLHIFYLKVAVLPLLVDLATLLYLGPLRFSRLLTTGDIDFIGELTPRRFHSTLPKLAMLAGLRYELTESI